MAIIIVISLIISFTWLYYLRLIDVFENEKVFHIVVTFVLGAIIPYLIYPIHTYIYEPLHIGNSRNPVLSLLFFIFGVGLLEELIKIIPVILALKFLKHAVNEPLDYLKYACVSALGFAFGENIEYATRYGHEVLLERSIFSVPAHMFLSSIFIYGYVLYKYKENKKSNILQFSGLSVLSHGLYDYTLDFEFGALGFLLTLIIFMLLVSAFIEIMNNSLNNSPFYSPKGSVDQEKVRNKLSLYYLPIIGGVFILSFIEKGAAQYLGQLVSFLFFKFFVLYMIIVRLSRYSIVESYWKPVKLELPFYIKRSSEQDRNEHSIFGIFVIKGQSYNDWHISKLFNESISVIPLNRNHSYLNKIHTGIIDEKVFINNSMLYKLKLLESNKYFIVKAKTNGVTHTTDNHPIVAIHSIKENDNLVFHEWVILKATKQ